MFYRNICWISENIVTCRLQPPTGISLIYLIAFEPPGVKLTIQGKHTLVWDDGDIWHQFILNEKKKLCHLNFFSNLHTSDSPCILPHCQIHKSLITMFTFGGAGHIPTQISSHKNYPTLSRYWAIFLVQNILKYSCT